MLSLDVKDNWIPNYPHFPRHSKSAALFRAEELAFNLAQVGYPVECNSEWDPDNHFQSDGRLLVLGP